MRNEINELVEQQGWNDSSLLELCLRFIESNKTNAFAFVAYLEKQADEENRL